MRVLVSSPLRPLAARMRDLAASCSRIDVMTAFVSRDALLDAVSPAVAKGAALRFLTGTFGNVTRAATFRQLHRLGQRPNAAVRIWDCGTHRNLHAKLYLWWGTDGGATVWVGSANLTDGGLQNEGELVAELVLASGDKSLAAVAAAFEYEWERGRRLDERFLKEYRESPRNPTFTDVVRRRRSRGALPPRNEAQRMFVVTASAHFTDDGAVATRVDELLGGTAEYWYRGSSRLLEEVRPGDWCLYIDTVDGDAGIVAVTDVVRDGKRVVFAFEELWDWRPFTARLKEGLAAIGLRRSRTAISGQWVPTETVLGVARLVHPGAHWDAGAARG